MEIRSNIAFTQQVPCQFVRISRTPLVIFSCHRGEQTPCSTQERHISTLICAQHTMPRRLFLRKLTFAMSLGLLGISSFPHEASAILNLPFAKPEDLIARTRQGAPKRPVRHLFQNDIYYPDYFAGVWNTESTLVSVTCPAGYKLFGRLGTFENAQRVSSCYAFACASSWSFYNTRN